MTNLHWAANIHWAATCRYPGNIKGVRLTEVQLYFQALTGEFVGTLLAQIDKTFGISTAMYLWLK